MILASSQSSSDQSAYIVDRVAQASAMAFDLLKNARRSTRALVCRDGKVDATLVEREQHAAHGLSWLATYVYAVEQSAQWARRLVEDGALTEIEELLLQVGVGEYLSQIVGGIAMSQGEVVRLAELGLSPAEIEAFSSGPVAELARDGNTASARARLAALLREQAGAATFGASGLDDTMEAIRDEMRKFSLGEVAPHAHQWHLDNAYIPLDIIAKMSDLGVFGLTIPEAHGGLGLSKVAMCVVSEELSRGYIGVGSLGTRAEIAAELILTGGTESQKEKYLPAIAAGQILPVAVFTEPDTGSDLASLRTRAVKDGNEWSVHGNKSWITHPVRANLMTLLVRTNPEERGHRGLSILLGEKPSGTDEDPFPVDGISGTEIEVLGYRGMKEYELAFEGFRVSGENLLGGVEGQGFRQLMETFESARIQTAARAIGVAQCALDLGLRYSEERRQFGKALAEFPRVSDKLVMMAVEINLARQLAYYAARTKDNGDRCDLEAGMAKLLGARVAWAAADNAVQIHGGNGFALEYEVSRVLCDARILSIFEGAAEIQAQVIARRLLETDN